MASIIRNPGGFVSQSFKGGMGNGAIAGLIQGIISAVGIHSFFARTIGGAIGASVVKNPTDRRIILVEATKEGVYQLLAGD